MARYLNKTRFVRECEHCGKTIQIGEYYHHRATDGLIVCEDCYNKLHNQWIIIKENVANELESIKDTLFSNPGITVDIKNLSSIQISSRIKKLAKSGYVIFGNTDNGFILTDCPEWKGFKPKVEQIKSSEDLKKLLSEIPEKRRRWFVFKTNEEYDTGISFEELDSRYANLSVTAMANELFKVLTDNQDLDGETLGTPLTCKARREGEEVPDFLHYEDIIADDQIYHEVTDTLRYKVLVSVIDYVFDIADNVVRISYDTIRFKNNDYSYCVLINENELESPSGADIDILFTKDDVYCFLEYEDGDFIDYFELKNNEKVNRVLNYAKGLLGNGF